MHEMSMCQGIVEAVVEEMGKLDPQPERLIKVRVVAGALHQIVPEYMTDAWTYLTRETPAEGSELELAFTAVRGRCQAEGCGWEGEIRPPVFQCPKCEGFDVELMSGKELYLDRMEVEQS
jgi:hydrogenase nickel incorporation protein HypA/HybF